MILVCDIGNSRIKSCFYNGYKISGIQSFINFEEFENSVLKKEFSDCVFSSVVPEKTILFSGLIKARSGKTPRQITHQSKFNLAVEYQTPETLGIDRLCSAEGAYFLFRDANESYSESDFIISVDFGTATTLNFIKYPGIFPGGMIFPGLKMMYSSLSNNTAQLPEVNEKDFTGLIGSDTKSSIASGVITSQTGLIEKTIKEIKREFKTQSIHIYITGGNAENILPFLKFEYHYVPELVMAGIIAVYKKNN